MKRLFLPIALAVATAMPLCASAQQGPPPGAPPDGGPAPMARPSLSPQHMQQMKAAQEQMRTMRERFRAQVLGALSPSHRALLASVAGNLAVAAHPDYRAAVRQLDAALSSGEKTAILADDKQMRGQMHAQMKSMMASMPHRPWPHPSGAPGMRHRGGFGHKGPHHAPSAGAILLALSDGGRGMMMMHGGWR